MSNKIAICGKLRSGKDTVADILKHEYGFTSFAFSDGIWKVIETIFPESYKNRNIEKPRRLLQNLGQYVRKIDENVWVDFTKREIAESKSDNILITDLRQPNELESLRDSGFYIVKVDTDIDTRIKRAKYAGDIFSENDMNHETESHLDTFNVDFVIDNNGDLKQLKVEIENMYKQVNQERRSLSEVKI